MECRSCNAHNPDGMVFCSVCGNDLPKSNPVATMVKPKLAVFHVEETVLDNAAGERIAKRKGLTGKRFEREVAANLEKAVSRVGVRDYINKLSRDNFTIAFISSLDPTYQYRLQDRLRHLGYPVMADNAGPLVMTGSSQDNIRSLAKRYDITFVFGTSGAGTAKQMNVPGVYATVNDYIGNTNNPYIAPEATPAPFSLSGLRPEPTPAPYSLANPSPSGFRFVCRKCHENPPMDECTQDARGVLIHMKDGGELRLVNEGMAQKMKQGLPQGPMRNPVPKPRRKTNKKTGKKRREPAKIYFERLMANKGMNKDFPDRSQRSAVALSYVEKEYGQRGIDSVTKTWGPMKNAPYDISDESSMTDEERMEAMGRYQEQQIAQQTADAVAADAEAWEEAARKAQLAANIPTLKARIDRWAQANIDPQLPQIIAKMKQPPFFSAMAPVGADSFTGTAKEELKKLHRDSRDAGFDMYAYLSSLYGVKVDLYHVGKLGADFWRISFDNTPPGYVPPKIPFPLPPVDTSTTGPSFFGNPPSSKKVNKAKAAYKKFHGGKTPDEITTAQVDVGDVWYSLGECWTIGYMSPKENGNEHQKFIHEMNEESKDGNYPILYATMPENGEPMLIIKGGSMKIGMRDGKAWLID